MKDLEIIASLLRLLDDLRREGILKYAKGSETDRVIEAARKRLFTKT